MLPLVLPEFGRWEIIFIPNQWWCLWRTQFCHLLTVLLDVLSENNIIFGETFWGFHLTKFAYWCHLNGWDGPPSKLVWLSNRNVTHATKQDRFFEAVSFELPVQGKITSVIQCWLSTILAFLNEVLYYKASNIVGRFSYVANWSLVNQGMHCQIQPPLVPAAAAAAATKLWCSELERSIIHSYHQLLYRWHWPFALAPKYFDFGPNKSLIEATSFPSSLVAAHFAFSCFPTHKLARKTWTNCT